MRIGAGGENLLDPACAQCAGPVEARQSKQLYIALSSLQGKLTAYLSTHAGWRKNACAFTKRYIDKG
jgi:methionyl-tRNA synthetase